MPLRWARTSTTSASPTRPWPGRSGATTSSACARSPPCSSSSWPGRGDVEDEGFPPGFFDRADEGDDAAFYVPPRFVTHIDDDAIAAVGKLYEELGVEGDVLDLMSSWVSHFRTPPARLRVLGMNKAELDANTAAAADDRIVHDLNADPRIPLPDECVDDVVCCASVDYL